MAQQAKLTVQKRAQVGRNAIKKVRKQGLIPAVFYGGDREPINLEINSRQLSTLLARAASENILLELEIVDGESKHSSLAMIQEIQRDPLQPEVVHVDFHAVSATEKLTAEVPIETVGEPVGVKTGGGLLEHILRSIEVECLPGDLPERIEVDVTNLDIGDSVHVKDLKLPSGVEALVDEDLTVVSVSEARVEEEEVAAAEAAPAAPEVITAKKPEEGAGASAES
ncbi:MAG: 50S ribosomal protein L25/general stress protein Ctc [Verrucomicrobia bacterium]|nr:50S ribosomal protein L25/general stress protein Ctc [Verrucomicrobiota bacterium]MBV9274052.1 50S ribosomal protein L25/general stress protein Ctc [Verrucomicrobiota bacterium]